MKQLVMNEETVNYYKDVILNPKKHDLPFPPLLECFEVAEEITAKHNLFKDYRKLVGYNIPKVMFYLAMQDSYGMWHGKAKEGFFGYNLTINLTPPTKSIMKKEKVTAGLCDSCSNCQAREFGDGVSEPFYVIPFCIAKNIEIEPVPLSDKEGQVLECEKYSPCN